MAETYQVFVRLLNGRHTILNFSSPSISSDSIKRRLHDITTIPIHHLRLLSDGRHFDDGTLTLSPSVADDDGTRTRLFPTVHLLLRLRGGKGGFGSLLRGAATKAGQKKTNNFDACRDMSGRRLRHVNAEKRLEEWRAEADGRRLEKVAEEFIKKKVKAVKKAGGSESDKYVEKYRKDSAKCMEDVEKSVRESLGNSKRKTATGADGSGSKRLKIWMGKRKLGDSDSYSDDTDEESDDDEENNKSAIIDNENHSDSSKEAERSSGSVTGGKVECENSGGSLSDSGSEEEKEAVGAGSSESHEISHIGSLNSEDTFAGEPASEIGEETTVQNRDMSSTDAVACDTEYVQADKSEVDGILPSGVEARVDEPCISCAGEGGATDGEITASTKSDPIVHEETVATGTNQSKMVKALNFDEFSSAAEMEVLGMDGLKTELQARGLKCGGTLQERAARLFLLKTTPVEMLPKKLLARK